MSKTLRFGLIGVGGIGGAHLNALEELETHRGVNLVAVADPALPQLSTHKEKLEARGVRWHLDYREMLNNGHDLDAVVIATPIPLHLEMTRQSLQHGLAVYLEKPPVPLVQQLEALIAEDPRAQVAVGFQMITAPAVQTLKKMVVSGALGELREFRVSACWPRMNRYYNRARWAGKMALSGQPVFDGPVTNALSHLIHNVMYLASGSSENFEVPVKIQAELYRVRPIESYDVACLRGWFESGVEFTAAFAHATQEMRRYRLEVSGSRGWARISDDGARFESSAGCSEFDPGLASAMVSSYTDFIDFLEGRRERPASRLADVRGFLRTTNGALISSGKIHEVRPSFQRVYGENDTAGYDVPGLPEVMDEMYRQKCLFSETRIPWAIPTEAVNVRGLTEIDFGRYCPSAPELE